MCLGLDPSWRWMVKKLDGIRLGLVAIVLAGFWGAAPHTQEGGAAGWVYLGPSGVGVTALSVDPYNSSTVYAGTFYGGFFRSEDNGSTWNRFTPMDLKSFRAVAFDPNQPGRVYALAYYNLYRTSDNGLSWTVRPLFPTDPVGNDLVHDPVLSEVLYMGNPSFAGGGIHRSLDGGSTWSPIGLPGEEVIRVAIEPTDRHTIYVETLGAVKKSADGGATWTTILSERAQLLLDPHRPGNLYAMTVSSTSGSSNGGTDWYELGAPEPAPVFTHLIAHPVSPCVFYGSASNGIFESQDCGTTWEGIGDGLPGPGDQPVTALALKPGIPEVLYAAVYRYSGGWPPLTPEAGIYAMVIDHVPPIVEVPEVVVVDAIGTDGAPVTFGSTALDDVDGPLSQSCSPSSGFLFPIGDTTVTCSATDSHGNTGDASFLVVVMGAEGQLGALATAAVQAFPAIQGGLAQDLLTKLDEARKALGRANLGLACHKVQQFSDKILTELDKKKPKLTPEQGEEFLSRAARLRAVLGC